MRIELFTLCDGAYNYNGKMTIVGTLTSLGVPKVPVNVQLGIALKIMVEPEESGIKNLAIRFFNPDGSSISADLTAQIDVKPKEEKSFISLAANVQNFPLSQLGEHTIQIIMNGEVLSDYKIRVVIKES